ncbi:MAG: DUF4065 domain-containing protein [Desulfovibrio sp.]|nr:DUF4065 domain-containing protein [Desulfovibrio sp.]
MPNCYDVAQYYVLNFWSLTKVKLHKLMYYTQGWYLAKYDTPLFDEDFYKWKNGSVIKDLQESMHFSDKIVPLDIPNANYDNITDENVAFFSKILQVYGDYSAEELIEMTHNEAPLIVTDAEQIITKNIIKNYFKSIQCQIL